MIEIEKKFILSEKEKDQILKDAQFLGEKIFTDIYYDKKDYSLTLKDYWLRFRDGRVELKVPVKKENNTFINQYEEIIDEDKIRQKIGIKKVEDLISDLNLNNYIPFCECKTTRTKYKKDIFSIDLDFVDFNDFSYNIAEVEITVENETSIDDAIEKINIFAKENNLKLKSVKGKVIEYINRKTPHLYNKLLKKGIVKE
ncbi:MAG TPA: CYTH domain-containing protein [Candidatus Pacearchaeota archaeon]|nr:CYTH domain-containing protein [Candidatus Pacearchaeota archaeon]